jgi:hypothetical protein
MVFPRRDPVTDLAPALGRRFDDGLVLGVQVVADPWIGVAAFSRQSVKGRRPRQDLDSADDLGSASAQ